MANRELPPRIYVKSDRYWHVRAEGKKRIWTKLTRVREGLPALYRVLADMQARDVVEDLMPAVIADWLRDVSANRSKKTQADDKYRTRVIGESLKAFRASQIRPPDIIAFLKPLRERPRTHNAYRADLRELMRYAEERGFREPGTNPVESVRTMTVRARARYITDSELRRIKAAAMTGKDGKRTRSGETICALIDMAYLTGQRIGDLLTLEWSQVGKDGILFEPAKLEKSTGARILIQWTPKLKDVERRLKALKRQNIRFVFTTQDGQPYTYWGAGTAWRRAVRRAGVLDCHFHDLRAKALTDKHGAEGMRAANTMGAHSTEAQTADYVRHKVARKTGATR